MVLEAFEKNRQYVKFCMYGFLKNLRFFDAFLLIFFIDNGLSFTQAGLLYAVRAITTNIFEVPSGLFADLYGRKNSLLGAFFLFILSFVVFYISTNFILSLIAMFLVGIGDAFRSGTHKGMIMDYLKLQQWENHKIAYYGHTRSWSQKGSALSALLAGIVVFFSGNYSIIFLISIIPYLFNFINIYTYPAEIDYALKKKGSNTKALQGVLKDFFLAIKKRKVLEIVNSSALHTAYLKSIKDYIQPLMVNIAVVLPILSAVEVKSRSGLVIGIAYFFIFLLASFASRKAGRLSALNIVHIERKSLLLGLLFGVACGGLYYFEYWGLSLLLFILLYVVENLRKPILTGFLVDNVPAGILTSILSAQSFYQTMATAILSVMIGFLADAYGIGMSLVISTLLLCVLTLLIAVKTQRSSS
jgi:MFS family permease